MSIYGTILSASLESTIPLRNTASLSTGTLITFEGNVFAHFLLSNSTWVFLLSSATKSIQSLMLIVSFLVF